MANNELPRVKEIEDQIAKGEMNAAQAFTQMKQLVYRQAPCHAFCEAQSFQIEARRKDKRIQELEAHVERLRGALITCHNAHDDIYPSAPEVCAVIESTPAQSLQAVKREAVEEYRRSRTSRGKDSF